MAVKTVDFVRQITNTAGQIGQMHIHVEDNVITGVKMEIAPVWLKEADFTAIQNVYVELRTWATTNGYTWAA
jgi:hypothetical protein